MKIVFVSNYFNHHQRPLSDALYAITEGNYHFIETAPMRAERRQLGYGWDNMPGYVLSAYKSETEKRESLKLIMEADAVIAGSAPEEYLRDRIRGGKLVLRYCERPLKNGLEPLKYLPRLLRWHLWNPGGKPIYLLAASAYAGMDYAKFGLFRNKTYRWGYFPERQHYEQLPEKEKNTLLWVGRFLDWKHPDDAILAAARLRDEGYAFQLRFIGTGVMEQQLQQMVFELGLEDFVCFLGPMKPEQVRSCMERASILLFTSDRREGWGAVVNEAMNSGCTVIASDAAGCVPYLIRHGVNGSVYRCGNTAQMAAELKKLLDHPETGKARGEAAYETITGLWNAEIAAARLVELIQGLLGCGPMPRFADGPCSAE